MSEARDRRALFVLHEQIRACTRCVDAGYIPSALPIVAGNASDRVMIVGHARGTVEVTISVPFSGRAGRGAGSHVRALTRRTCRIAPR